jgi:hypothetical protein
MTGRAWEGKPSEGAEFIYIRYKEWVARKGEPSHIYKPLIFCFSSLLSQTRLCSASVNPSYLPLIMTFSQDVAVGVLALQGAFNEHVQLLRQAAQILAARDNDAGKRRWTFTEVRTAAELAACDALIIPGGESTTMSLVAERSGVLEPLRDFVK